MLRERLKGLGSDLLVITEFGGDAFVAKLVLCSNSLVQKQSTVAFLILVLKAPMISYNLVDTDYEGDIHKANRGVVPRRDGGRDRGGPRPAGYGGRTRPARAHAGDSPPAVLLCGHLALRDPFRCDPALFRGRGRGGRVR